MGKLIVITFAFMAFAFYELSGGSEFVAIADEKRAVAAIAQKEETRRLADAKAERLKAKPEVVLASMSATPAVALVQAAVIKQDDVAIIVTPALDSEKAETLTAGVAVASADMREVSAARVNMRQGPGQNFSVVAKLTNGQMVEILQDPGDGWVKLRVQDSGRVGWMADFLLTASDN